MYYLGDEDDSVFPQEGRIVGGYQTTIEQVPYIAVLLTATNNSIFCAGSIISNQWIVTAAHCIVGMRPEDIKIRVGSSDYTEGGQLVDAIAILTNPNFDRVYRFDYDVGLIKINNITINNSTVATCQLPGEREYPSTGSSVLASGWGYQQSGGTPSRIVRAVLVRITFHLLCRLRYANLTNNMICAADTGKDTCQADSGGPLILPTARGSVLVGITSHGSGCALVSYPGVYTSVATPVIRRYIRDNTGI